MIRPSRIALVAAAAFAAACASGAIAGLLSGLAGSPQLLRFLLIPAILLTADAAGRWIARRDSPPAKAEFAIGGLIYVLLSASDALSQGGGIALAVAGSAGFVLLVVYSALADLRTVKPA